MIDNDDKQMLDNIVEKVDALIEKELEKACIDRAYFSFKLTATIFSIDFQKMDEMVLFDDQENYFCAFCGEKTMFYDSKHNMRLCPKCYARLETDEKFGS